MANRDLTSASITALGSDNVEFYHLLELAFDTPLYYTNAPYDIVYDGNTYISSPIVKNLPDANESLKIKPSSFPIDLSGVAEATHALVLTENYKNKAVNVYRYIVATEQAVILYAGYCDGFDASEDLRGSNSTIKITCANHWTNWESTNGAHLSHKIQQDLYPGDLFFEFVDVTQNIINWWGKPTTTSYYQQSILYRRAEIFSRIRKLPVFYGQREISGEPIFRAVSGTGNKFLWVVYTLAHGECNSLENIRFNVSDIYKDYDDAEFNSSVSYTFYSGTTTQTADASLVAASLSWTTSHIGKGVCYVIVKYDKTLYKWQGEPQPVFDVKGKKLYDLRDGTTSYSTNPALVLYDYLTSSAYGKGLSSDVLSRISEGATYCETQNTDHDAALAGTPATIDLFSFNGEIDASRPIQDNVNDILFTMRAHLPWISGKYTLVIERDDDTSVYSFNGDNISAFRYHDKRISETANEVYYEWVDPSIDQGETITLSSSATYLAADNNRVLTKKFGNKFENNRYRANNRAATLLKQSRQEIGVEITSSNADSFQIECGDVVDLTRVTQGWTNKLFRVVSISMSKKGTNRFMLEEYESTVYDWEVSVEESLPANSELLNPNVVVAPTGLTVTATDTEAITATDGTTIHRLKLTWTAPADAYGERINVQYRENGATNWIPDQDIQNTTDTETYIHGVTVGSSYDCRIRVENSLGIYSSWNTVTNTTVTGSSVTGFNFKTIGTDSYANDSFFFHTPFDSLDGYAAVNATILPADGLKLVGDASVVSTCLRDFVTQNITLTNSKNHRMKTRVKVTGASSLASTSSTIAAARTGFRFYWNSGTSMIDIVGWNTDGSSYETATIVSVADGTEVDLDLVFTTGSIIDFTVTVSGTPYTATSSTNLPTGTTFANRPVWCAIDSGTAGVSLFVGDYLYIQEP